MTKTPRTTVRRHPERGAYDRATVRGILDAGFLCHAGFVDGDQPFVIPTLYCRVDDTLYLHGSPLSRMLGRLAEGIPLCVTVTHLDGIVLARSAFNSSINYRSVVVLGRGHLVEDDAEKRAATDALVEQVCPGRTRDARAPTEKELAATSVIAVPMDEASAKIRTGGPKDPSFDLHLPMWAGVVPLHLQVGDPVPDPELLPNTPVPDYLRTVLDRG
jgi:nitroimidazol reductase NimA-like FMN-containing flavoprotein (pyridoxamine 5'-phosphate oxidase superfamily)